MSKDTLLTFVGTTCSDEAVKNAIDMADHQNAHLSIVVVANAPQIYSYGYGAHLGGYTSIEQWTNDVAEISARLEKCADNVEKLAQAAQISADVTSEYCDMDLLRAAILRHANVADRVIVMNNVLAGDLEDLVISTIAFHAPVSLIKGTGPTLAELDASRILIAWDSSSHAAKAVHHALPMLKAAEEVTIAIFDPVRKEYKDGEEPGADLASWLSRHGCNVTIAQYPSGGQEIASCILDKVAEKGVGLVVMGAYSHMKLRQQIFGGTTQSMLEQNKVPVLVAHT